MSFSFIFSVEETIFSHILHAFSHILKLKKKKISHWNGHEQRGHAEIQVAQKLKSSKKKIQLTIKVKRQK